jgi:TonB family protein
MPSGDRAVLDLVIGANGLVESVRVRQGLHPLYDTILLQSARNWRYEPARLNGQAVRYARALELRVQLQ